MSIGLLCSLDNLLLADFVRIVGSIGDVFPDNNENENYSIL